MDFSNLKLAQCSNFKMLKSILDDGIIYFEQKILLSLTNLRSHSLNILKSISPKAHAFFHRKTAVFYYFQLEMEIGAWTHSRKPLCVEAVQ